MNQKYSVLMSVYHKEKAEHLRTAMQSMFDQTVPPEEFLLICDGPLNGELDSVIADMELAHPGILRVIRLEKNGGLGNALRLGVTECRNELIARMDSDDISRRERCEKQLSYLAQHPEVSVVGGFIEEFSTTPEEVSSRREVPETHEQIIKFAKRRSPFNHPSVMYRKADVLAAGNYQDVRYTQDYYLWTAMLVKGFRGHNLQEPLVWMRADANLYKRRSGKLYIQIQCNLFRYMLEHKFITYPEYLISCAIRIGSSLAPNGLRKFLFKKFLRK